MSFQQILETLNPYVNNILKFDFQISDPAFWVFILIIFLMTLRMWGGKRALSFSLVIAAALIINTHLEGYVSRLLYRPDDLFRFIVRGATVLFITILGIYYAFLKGD